MLNSAADQVRNLLDELMGGTADAGVQRLEFDDPRVCKSFLLDCCPHEILSGTRMVIGECSQVHQVGLKSDYRRECAKRPYHYEVDALNHLENFISNCNRRTEAAKVKLRETQEQLNDETAEQVEGINKLSEEIGTTLAKAEQLGADGHVDESLKMMEKIDELHQQKSQKETELRSANSVTSYQQQKLRVCEVCCSYLGVHDNDRRLADHFGGKLHLGFIQIREKLLALRMYVSENDLIRKRNQLGEVRREVVVSDPSNPLTAERSRDVDKNGERKHKRRHHSRSHSHKRSRHKKSNGHKHRKHSPRDK